MVYNLKRMALAAEADRRRTNPPRQRRIIAVKRGPRSLMPHFDEPDPAWNATLMLGIH